MVTDSPLTELPLSATSAADDLGFLALADLSRALHKDAPDAYRIIGGHMLTALVARWELGAELYRETADTDLGVPPLVIRELGLDGSTLHAPLTFPDEVAALVLKALATQVRFKDTDVVDLWRCLEVCLAAGNRPENFAVGEPAAAAAIVRALFAGRRGPGMDILTAEQRLSQSGADQRHTRLRALTTRVLGPS